MKNIEFLLTQVIVELIVRKFNINSRNLSYILMYLYLNNNESKVCEINDKNKFSEKRDNMKCKNMQCNNYVKAVDMFSNRCTENINIKRENNIKNSLKNTKNSKILNEKKEFAMNFNNVKHNTEKEICSTTVKEYKNLEKCFNTNKRTNKKFITCNLKENILKSDVVVTNSKVNDLVLGEVEFNEPVLKILNAKSEISTSNPVCFKSENKKEGILIYKGLLTTTIKYLKPKNVVTNGFCSESKYYTLYTPFEVSRKIPLEFNVFKNGEEVIKNIKMNVNQYKENICTELISYSNENGQFKSKYKIINAFDYNVEILKEEKFKLDINHKFKESG